MNTELLLSIGLLLLGFVLLVKGADFFVDGSSSVAKTLHVPALIIGMTIVAMGTSLPELSVSVISSMNGSNSLAVSNVIGSNLFNLVVVLGASAAISPLYVNQIVVKRDYPFCLLCTLVLAVTCYLGAELGHSDGLILALLFVLFLFLQVRSALQHRKQETLNAEEQAEEALEEDEIKLLPLWQAFLYIIGGAVAVKFGGDFVVDSATTIARSFGLSETLIGLTIVACGTSLPELVTSIQAARKNELDLAIGNVIGSNLFNILLVLGVASLISPIAILTENIVDMAILLGVSLIIWILCRLRGKLGRVEGILMLLAYAAYMVYIILR